jgi:CRP-like cAMP-binding protein
MNTEISKRSDDIALVRGETRPGPINRWMQALRLEDLARLQPYLRKVAISRGQVLQEAQSPIRSVYFPLSGMVALMTVMRTGEMIDTAIIGSNGIIGSSIVDGSRNSFSQAVVHIPGEALRIESANFVSACRDIERLHGVVKRFESLLLIKTQQNAACHGLHDISARFARRILHAEDLVGSSTIDLTQDAVSQMLGVRRTSVSVVAQTLQQAGLIGYSRGHIRVLDRARLEQSACECYGVIRDEIKKALATFAYDPS